MRQKLLETSGGSGKGEVRMHQSEQGERNSLLWAVTEFKQVLGRELDQYSVYFWGKRKCGENLGLGDYWCSLRKMSSVKFLFVFSSGEIFCVCRQSYGFPCHARKKNAWLFLALPLSCGVEMFHPVCRAGCVSECSVPALFLEEDWLLCPCRVKHSIVCKPWDGSETSLKT